MVLQIHAINLFWFYHISWTGFKGILKCWEFIFVIQQLYPKMQKIFLAGQEDNISVLINPLTVTAQEAC